VGEGRERSGGALKGAAVRADRTRSHFGNCDLSSILYVASIVYYEQMPRRRTNLERKKIRSSRGFGIDWGNFGDVSEGAFVADYSSEAHDSLLPRVAQSSSC
jgi:hypothetical protein